MTNEQNKIFECKTCLLKFDTSDDLLEHKWTFLHHVKLEKLSGQCKHGCDLCQITTDSLADFSKHLECDQHKTNLSMYEFQKRLVKNIPKNPSFNSPWSANQNNFANSQHSSVPQNYGAGPSTNFKPIPPHGFSGYPPPMYPPTYGNFGYSGYDKQGYRRFNQPTRPQPWGNPEWGNPHYKKISANGGTEFNYRKKFKHACGVRYNQSHNSNGPSNIQPRPSILTTPTKEKVIIPNTNAFFEPDVPINIKNMPNLEYRKNMQTNTNMHASKGLEKKFEWQLKQQKKMDKLGQKPNVGNKFNQNNGVHGSGLDSAQSSSKSKKKHSPGFKNLRIIKKQNKKTNVRSIDFPSEETAQLPDSTTPSVDVEATIVVEADPSDKDKSHPSAANVTTKKQANFADSMKKAFSRFPASTPADISRRLLADRINKYRMEAAPSTSSTFTRSISESEAASTFQCSNDNLSSETKSTKGLTPPSSVKISSSSSVSLKINDRSKQILSDVVESVRNSSKLESKKANEAELTNSSVDTKKCKSKKRRSEIILKDKDAQFADKAPKWNDSGHCHADKIPLESSVTSLLADVGNPNGVVSAISASETSNKGHFLNAAQFLVKRESENSFSNHVESLQTNSVISQNNSVCKIASVTSLPKETVIVNVSSSNTIGSELRQFPPGMKSFNPIPSTEQADNSQMSKMKLLWEFCQKEQKYEAELLAANNELVELELRVEECRKRKIEAEVNFSNYKEQKRQLLLSEAGNDFGSHFLTVSSQLEQPFSMEPQLNSCVKLTYLGMVSAEQSVVQNLESVFGVSLGSLHDHSTTRNVQQENVRDQSRHASSFGVVKKEI